ncbi:hypothetical protein C7M84_020730 [Penaeus vannamei]|uniref:EGF-like domain-containing protein n=1 Tax=Penaeus vannamei TaxID=6689 RepID=A0A3R7MGW1_PENVA|nr:hypothetical protein C7M84_020730 [Penaeus vannamei]
MTPVRVAVAFGLYHRPFHVDECQSNPCVPTPSVDSVGSYSCQCQEYYTGDPYIGCVDITHHTYMRKRHKIIIPFSSSSPPRQTSTSARPSTARAASTPCQNAQPGYTCVCPQGYSPSPTPDVACKQSAVDILCRSNFDCVNNAECRTGVCFCRDGFQAAGAECRDVDECRLSPCGPNAQCQNVPGSFQCSCNFGFIGNPPDAACKISHVDECLSEPFPCGEAAKCTNTFGSFVCACPFPLSAPCEGVECGPHATCKPDGVEAMCMCDPGWTYDPKDITADALVNVDECTAGNRPSGQCGDNAVCTNTLGSFACQCPPGFSGNPNAKCLAKPLDVPLTTVAITDRTNQPLVSPPLVACADINECLGYPFPCGKNAKCTNTRGITPARAPSPLAATPKWSVVSMKSPTRAKYVDECRRPGTCGLGAVCTNTLGSFSCSCPPNTVADPDPFTQCLDIMKCADDNDCPGNALCLANQCMCPEPNIGDDCRHPCEDVRCGPNAECKLINGQPKCLCAQGYSGNPIGVFGCTDVNECVNNPCGKGAVCRNEPGKFTCECPSGFEGDAAREGCIAVKSPDCSVSSPCPTGEQCVEDKTLGSNVCVCQRGYVRDPQTGSCRDINECLETVGGKLACGSTPTARTCPGPTTASARPASSETPSASAKCNTLECTCLPPYRIVDGICVLANCSLGNRCPAGAECVTIQGGLSYCACPAGYTTLPDGSCQDVDECVARLPNGRLPCGPGAECYNQVGGFECRCPPDSSGDAYTTGCSKAQEKCSSDSDCLVNERCVQPGKCVCPPPYFVDNQDNNRCKSPCEAFSCGINSKCTPTDPPQCMCQPGFVNRGPAGCVDIDECRENPCGQGAICINEIGTFKCECPPGTEGDPFIGTCNRREEVECRSDDDCPGDLACTDSGECVNPCDALPCGSNAYCEAEDHAAWCRCHPGYAEGPTATASPCARASCAAPTRTASWRATAPPASARRASTATRSPAATACPTSARPPTRASTRRCASTAAARSAARASSAASAPSVTRTPTSASACPSSSAILTCSACLVTITPPLCTPGCGANAHCEYGEPNRCVCNTGYSGNPYASCASEDQKGRLPTTRCGTSAECRQGVNRVDCVCPVGYQGNPTWSASTSTSRLLRQPLPDVHAGHGRLRVVSGEPAACPDSPCATVVCGPNALCTDGTCTCLQGFKGDPSNLSEGCQPAGCQNDLFCADNEICFSSGGRRTCVDACNKVECGPNAFCVAQAHRSACLCKDSYKGNPNDLTAGCQPEDRESKCTTDSDCSPGQVCQVDAQGLKACVDPCFSYTCGQNEICYSQAGRPLCRCDEGYLRNPQPNNARVKPNVPDCQDDRQCPLSDACRPDQLGVLKCVGVCQDFNCPLHSSCFAVNHRGQCHGCRPLPRDECQSDAQCSETEKCETRGNVRKCMSVCETTRCGPNAVCVANNHAAQCQCPPDKACNRLDFTCFDVCYDACGDNAICLAENHRYNCKCPPGSRPNPSAEIECVAVNLCDPNPCHTSATCSPVGGNYQCSCPVGMVGDPYTTGCHPKGMCPSGNDDCPLDSVCINGRCASPCDRACGPNAQCNVVNRKPICTCPTGFVPNPTPDKGCTRLTSSCNNDAQCQGGVCLDGQCKVVCRDNSECAQGERCYNNMCMVPCVSSSQCPTNQACISGVCLLGCRGNTDCPTANACVNNKCDDPCSRPNVWP